jgi:hypothetical protein
MRYVVVLNIFQDKLSGAEEAAGDEAHRPGTDRMREHALLSTAIAIVLPARTMLTSPVENGNRDAARTDQSPFRVTDFRLPHLDCAPNVNRPCYTFNNPLPGLFYVIGVDFDTNTDLRIVDAAIRGGAPQRFGEGNRCSAVKDTERLYGSLVHGHRRFDKVGADFRKLNSEMIHHRS